MSCKYKNDIFVKICQKKNICSFFINIFKLFNTDIIVTPTSASFITGALFMPSPTKAVLLYFLYSSKIFTLS